MPELSEEAVRGLAVLAIAGVVVIVWVIAWAIVEVKRARYGYKQPPEYD